MGEIRFGEVTDQSSKHAICEGILRGLPLWFGVEASIVEYAQKSREQRLYAALDDGEPVGFVMLKRHNPYTCEVYCMGLLEPYHRRGIGRQLIDWCVREATAQGARFLTVKTLADTDPDVNYARTRAFYEAMSFLPLEIFPTIWGEENPCLFLVKVLER